MIFDRTAGGHRFDFIRGVCFVCGISREEFKDNSYPRCTGELYGALAEPGHPMTRNEIQLLKELTAAGEHGRVINTLTASARSEIEYLTSAHYIKRLSHTKLYVITERGREALSTIAEGDS